MAKFIFGIAFIAILYIIFNNIFCNKDESKESTSYRYVELRSKKGITVNPEITECNQSFIYEDEDSTAYIIAYKKFRTAIELSKDLPESNPLIGFRLLNNQDSDIVKSVNFSNKAKLEKEITANIGVEAELNRKNTTINKTKAKLLSKHFSIVKDEFSNKIWYKPKNAPSYVNSNGLYCYFSVEDGVASNLRFKLQYYADEWLFINEVVFSIDGNTFEYTPGKMETDSGDGGYIWEWFDDSVTNEHFALLNALASGKSAKMKLIGNQYHKIKIITPLQIKTIKRTLQLYEALGGN